MTIIDTKREDIRALKGAHLFHFATSNCSQRVRFVLEEKSIDWVSHHVDLVKCENATPDFLELNPAGVVPVFIHDGKTVVESNDIIRYIDENFAGPVLHPNNTPDMGFLEDSLKRSSEFQASFKLITHEFLFKPFRRMDDRKLESYSVGTKNSELTSFMREFSSAEGFSRERIVTAVSEAETLLHRLEARLEKFPWLTGDQFGLTDISWVVNIYRFTLMRYPLQRFERVSDWLHRMRSRPAFGRAITQFESRKITFLFRAYSQLRRVRRSSVDWYIPELRSR